MTSRNFQISTVKYDDTTNGGIHDRKKIDWVHDPVALMVFVIILSTILFIYFLGKSFFTFWFSATSLLQADENSLLCSTSFPLGPLPCFEFSKEKRRSRAHFSLPKCIEQGRRYYWPLLASSCLLPLILFFAFNWIHLHFFFLHVCDILIRFIDIASPPIPHPCRHLRPSFFHR